ncbi:MAG TPA: prepilin-type N-terminal cleavage/methylation domain-containing protein [Candidatus Cybelea sp.]|nr:prepilin-type N-terminal cleavage/methylation domain-containing protein [Candidatus Cybelea sp.]
MKLALKPMRQLGFTLIELLTALGIFLLITGAAFGLLSTSQQRYQTESQVLTSFQEARLGLDQMARDINDAGFPPPIFFSSSQPQFSTSSPFAWSLGSGYPNSPCQIGTGGGGTCTTATANDSAPGDFDLIIETNPNPQDAGSPVQWIRYQLQGTTLMRGVANKIHGDDPDADTSAAGLVPFVQNVVNNACPPALPQCQTAYPVIFGGGPVPIFSYICDTPTVPQYPAPLCSSLGAGADNSPANIRDVAITLIVAAPLPDATTGMPRLVQLSGRGRRVNPNH